MSDERVAPRRRTLKTGTIEFGGGIIDCTISNLSDVGAALDVVSPVGIPTKFNLILPGGGLQKRCHVVWRSEKRMTVWIYIDTSKQVATSTI
jgi:hypothetical protein